MGEETSTEQVVKNSHFRDLSAKLPKDPVKRSLFLLIILIALPVLVILAQRAIQYLSRAATADLYFEPVGAELPPDSTLRLWVDSNATQVGFAMFEVNFDPTKVNLVGVVSSDRLTMNNAEAESDPNYVPPEFACQGADACIIKTPVADANTTGTIKVVLGMDPTDSGNPPGDVAFELARFTFTTNTSENVNTLVSVSTYQLVDMSATDFDVTVLGPATLTLNPVGATETPTPTSTGTPPPGVPGDLDEDGDVDIFDYNQLVTDFDWTGTPGAIPADIDEDGDVDIFDYNTLVSNFGIGT